MGWQYITKSVLALTQIFLTAGLVLFVLILLLHIESVIMQDNNSLQDFVKALFKSSWTSLRDLITFLDESIIFGAIEGVSIITAMVLFVQGRREEERQAHHMAWSTIDQAYGRETSAARFHALQELHEDGISLKGLDVPGADLAGIALRGVDLHESTLERAKLDRADLQGARLDFANLQKADLQRAILQGAGLLDANLQEANLGGANLTNADLRSANLQNATLFSANLMNADLRGANLTGVSFRRARNLKPQQVMEAMNWELADYDEKFRAVLGLPPLLLQDKSNEYEKTSKSFSHNMEHASQQL
jgi:uncharacterized protein YjbI with pentapeptide repeats